MDSWINARTDYGAPEIAKRAILLAGRGMSRDPLVKRLGQASAEERARLARLIIAERCPLLADCELQYVGFDFCRCAWEFGVTHPALPVVDDHAMSTRFDLTEPFPAGSCRGGSLCE
jgi:hypothetical protein